MDVGYCRVCAAITDILVKSEPLNKTRQSYITKTAQKYSTENKINSHCMNFVDSHNLITINHLCHACLIVRKFINYSVTIAFSKT